MAACTARCLNENFETTPCTNTTNRVCTACKTKCTAEEFEEVACTEFSDRVCKPLAKNISVSFAMTVPIQNVTVEVLDSYSDAVAASLGIDPKYVTATTTPPSFNARRRLLQVRRLLQSNVNIYFIINIPEANVSVVLANSTIQLNTTNVTEALNNVSLVPNITLIAETIVATILTQDFNTTLTQVLTTAQLVVATVDPSTVVSTVVLDVPPNCPPNYFCVGSNWTQCSAPCAPGSIQTKACSVTKDQVCSPCPNGSFCLGGLHQATCRAGCDAGNI
jgi:hypothetical protein